MDAGDPISYLVLEQGTTVLSREGETVGTVAHVLADEGKDIFEGIVIEAAGRSTGHVFAEAEHVAEIRERAVCLTLDLAAAQALPEPTENPAVMSEDPGAEIGDSGVSRRLRRAWDLISGKY